MNTTPEIAAEDLRRALEQKTEIELVVHGKCRIAYDAYLQLFRVFDGGREHFSSADIVSTTSAYNDLVTGR
jgi:hypothetical protein